MVQKVSCRIGFVGYCSGKRKASKEKYEMMLKGGKLNKQRWSLKDHPARQGEVCISSWMQSKDFVSKMMQGNIQQKCMSVVTYQVQFSYPETTCRRQSKAEVNATISLCQGMLMVLLRVL